MNSLNPRFAEAPAMVLVGIRRHHKISEASATVPAQWQEFRALGLRSTRAPRAFGVYCQAQGDTFEYMTALEEKDVEDSRASLGRIRVPAQRYAVFLYKGHVSGLGELWQRVLEEWLPASDYVDAETPAFELYDSRFDPETGAGEVEVWCPVKPRA